MREWRGSEIYVENIRVLIFEKGHLKDNWLFKTNNKTVLWDLWHIEIKRVTAVAQKIGRSEIEVYCSKVLTACKVVYYLMVHCDKLKMYTLNPKKNTFKKKAERYS